MSAAEVLYPRGGANRVRICFVLRIHFTATDLASVRICAQPDPLWELALSMHHLRLKATPVTLSSWKERVVGRLRPDGRLRAELASLLAINPPVGYFPDFLTPIESSGGFDPGVAAILATPMKRMRGEVSMVGRSATQRAAAAMAGLARGEAAAVHGLERGLRRYREVALDHLWQRITSAFAADRTLRTRHMADGGLGAFLSRLHPTAHFANGILHIGSWGIGAERDMYRDEARGLLREAVAACDQLPPESTRANFGFDQAVQASLFARSGARDERSEALGPVPTGVDPDQPLQPVPGLSFHRWSFSVRQAYRAGLAAIDEAIAAITDPPARRQDPLAELALLMRRRAIRASVLCHGPVQFQEEVVAVLAHSVSLERRLVAVDPSQDTRRLIRALTDQAMGHLVAGVNTRASDALSEALDLHVAAGYPSDLTSHHHAAPPRSWPIFRASHPQAGRPTDHTPCIADAPTTPGLPPSRRSTHLGNRCRMSTPCQAASGASGGQHARDGRA